MSSLYFDRATNKKTEVHNETGTQIKESRTNDKSDVHKNSPTLVIPGDK